jgi:hypothetical protein
MNYDHELNLLTKTETREDLNFIKLAYVCQIYPQISSYLISLLCEVSQSREYEIGLCCTKTTRRLLN